MFVVATTLFLGNQLRYLKVNADVLESLPDSDKNARLLKRIAANFGGNNIGVVILETDNVYQTKVLEQVQAITDSLKEIKGIISVSSLTNIIQIKRTDEGIEVGTLVDEYDLPESKEALDALKEAVLANEMYKGSIVSEDGTATLVMFTLDGTEVVNSVAANVISVISKLGIKEKVYYSGSPMLVSAIAELMRKDLTTLLPIAFILIAVVLFISFRSVAGVILPLLTASIAIIWTLGTMSLLGYNMSMISNNIPIILLAIGSSYAIHVINSIHQQEPTEAGKEISISLSYVLIPVFLAAITTAIGFVSFIFGSYLRMIVEFGIFTTLGTLFSFILSILFVPAILKVISSNKKVSGTQEAKPSVFIDNLLGKLNTFLFSYPKAIVLSWVALFVISIAGVFSIERKVDIQEYFKKDNPTRIGENIQFQKFGGTKPVFVLFTGNVKSPEVLNKMMETSKHMEKSPDIYTTMSVAHLISELNFAVSGRKEIPKSAEEIEQLWFLIDGNETLGRLVSADLTEGIIISKFKSPDNEAKKSFSSYMDAFIKANKTKDCNIEITGMPFVDVTMDQSLIRSQIGSILIAIFCVMLIVGFILRSGSSGLLVSLPIIAAISILFGFMGLTGISLNIATVLVASVALGIGIDYSIHFISHFNHSLKSNGALRTAVENTLTNSGKAIIINVFSVAIGFLVLIFSEMVPLQYFGMLIALCMISSGLGALTLLPAVLILLHKKNITKQ
jgi:predicted RND superfamily exporter protein